MSDNLALYPSRSCSRSNSGVRCTVEPTGEAPAAPPSPVLDAVESSPMRERRIATSKVCAHLARLLAWNSLQASPFTAWSGNVWRVHEGNEAQQVESVNQNQTVTSIFGLRASMQHVAFRTNKLPASALENLLLISAVLEISKLPLSRVKTILAEAPKLGRENSC